MGNTSGAFPRSLGIKQFRNDGCLSYLFFDRETKQAAVIDPCTDIMDEYREYVAQNGLKIVVALDTHVHADHYSATHLFKSEYGAEIGMSYLSPSARLGRKLKLRDAVAVGAFKLEVLETPGHTPDSLSLYGEGLLFTGDTLFIGASGRTDLPGGDPQAQWKSLHEVLGRLPDETIVFPGHDYNGLIFSTIGTEKKKNPHWLAPSLDQFVEMKKAQMISGLTAEISDRIAFNLLAVPTKLPPAAEACTACGVPNREVSRVASINIEKYAHKIEEKAAGTAFIDVREPDEFREGHMPGVENVPVSELALRLMELSAKKRLYFNCQGGGRSSRATSTFNYLGFPDAVNVNGGWKAWVKAGFPVAK